MALLSNSIRHSEPRFPKHTGSPAGPVKVEYWPLEVVWAKYGKPGQRMKGDDGKPSPVLRMYYERLERKGIAE